MTTHSLPDLSRWVSLREDRPPRVLHVLFWGAVLTALGTYALVLVDGMEDFPTGDPFVDAVILASVVSMVACCVLWPFLGWSKEASGTRKALSFAFLVLSLFCLATSNYTVFLLVCVATINALAVFGLPGGIAYGVSVTVFASAIGFMVPDSPLWLVPFMALTQLFLVCASAVVYIALAMSSQRAERTRELLVELEHAHAELRHQNLRVREMTVAEERARMSREMHDSTGHYLTALAMSLSNALRFRTRRPEAAWDEVEQARDLARDALTDTRRWVRALRPLQLEGRAGIGAMRAMAESFHGGGIHVEFTDTGTWPELSEEAELVCYRALQEGLTNAMRHSGANRIEVTVAADAETVAVTVSDNGGGASDETAHGGFGLRGLAERVEAIGGTVHTERPTEGGFRLRVEVGSSSDRADTASRAKEGVA